MAKCPKCGTDLSSHPNFCPGCGVKVTYKIVNKKQYPDPKTLTKEEKQPVFEDYDLPLPNLTLDEEPNRVKTVEPAKEQTPVAAPVETPKEVKEEKPEHPYYEGGKLKTNRGFIKLLHLSLITLGIYSLVFFYRAGKDINNIRKYYGDRKRMGFFGSLFLSIITLGIPLLVFSIRVVCSYYRYATIEKVDRGSAAFFFISMFLLPWTLVCPIIADVQMIKTMNNISRELESRRKA